MTTGEENLPTLLATMQPILDPTTYVFITTTQPLSALPLSTLQPQLIAQEVEGITIVTTEALAASHGFTEAVFPSKKISLSVHSSLEAIGLIATITNRLRDHRISTNVVSGFYHDHIYVPAGLAEDAIRVLGEISKEAN
ncbi:COG3602 family protein [Lipomyces kononenkoae]